ncbi:MAG: MFS transporter, partial [Bdellovibrionota bacterium]
MPRLQSKVRAPRILLAALAAIQFVHVLDFIILMPLGPQLMLELGIGPASFGLVVSTYNIAAAIAGLAGALILDRFDRKSAMLWSFAGLTAATFLCGFAPSFGFLLAARFAAGVFGGMILSLGQVFFEAFKIIDPQPLYIGFPVIATASSLITIVVS